MGLMMDKMRMEIDKIDKALMDIMKFKQREPEGILKCQKKGNEVFFYQQYRNEESGKWETQYIKRENISLVKDLAQKQYYAKLKPLLEKKRKLIKDFTQKYCPEEMEAVYEDLTEERKALVLPIFVSKKEIIHRWNNEKYEGNAFHPEKLRFETQQGELVRSKSEVIIANILYSHREDILYKYERPLVLETSRTEKTIYPDFTILNLDTGKITYWEHAGRMDDTYYANEFVKKMNIYVSNGVLPGRDVLVTFETMSNQLDVSVVKKMIEELCVKNS